MKLYKYCHTRRGYDGTRFVDRGYVFAENENLAKEYVMEEQDGEGKIELIEETRIIHEQ